MSAVTNLYESIGFTAAVAAEVRAQAARRGLLQKDVRELLGLQKAGASSRWNGKVPFRLEEIGILCEAWGIAPADLMPSKWSPAERSELPRLDLNQQPCGYAYAQVIDLPRHPEHPRVNPQSFGRPGDSPLIERRRTTRRPTPRPFAPVLTVVAS
jgi:hypothetical protein